MRSASLPPSVLLALACACSGAPSDSTPSLPVDTKTEPVASGAPSPEPEAEADAEPEATEKPTFTPLDDEQIEGLITELKRVYASPWFDLSDSVWGTCPKGSQCLVFDGSQLMLLDPSGQTPGGAVPVMHDELLPRELPEAELDDRLLRATRMLVSRVDGPVAVHCDAAGRLPKLVGWEVQEGTVALPVGPPSKAARSQRAKVKRHTPAQANTEVQRIATKLRFDETHDARYETLDEFWAKRLPFAPAELDAMTGDTMAAPTLRVVEDYWAPMENDFFLQVFVVFSPESRDAFVGDASVVGDRERLLERGPKHRDLLEAMLIEAGAQTLRFSPGDACWLPESVGGQWLPLQP